MKRRILAGLCLGAVAVSIASALKAANRLPLKEPATEEAAPLRSDWGNKSEIATAAAAFVALLITGWIGVSANNIAGAANETADRQARIAAFSAAAVAFDERESANPDGARCMRFLSSLNPATHGQLPAGSSVRPDAKGDDRTKPLQMTNWTKEQFVPGWDCLRAIAAQDRSKSTFQNVCAQDTSEDCRDKFIDNVTLDPLRLAQLSVIPRAWLRSVWREAIIYGNIRADYYATLSLAAPKGEWSKEVCDRIPPVNAEETAIIIDNKVNFHACSSTAADG